MKKRFTVLLCYALSMMTASALASDAFSVNTRADVWFGDYEADIKRDSPFGIKLRNKFQTFHTVLRLGLTAAWHRFYLDGYYQTTNNDSDTVEYPEIGYHESFDADRDEYTVSLAYRFDPFVVFLGHRHSDADSSGDLGSDYEIKSDAFFIGGTYSWQVADTGVLSVNAAYAHMHDALLIRVSQSFSNGRHDRYRLSRRKAIRWDAFEQSA